MTFVVIFIDSRVGDPAAIVGSPQPDTDYHVLAADEDGVGQMRRILAGYSDLAAIHVVSHGGEGASFLGSTTLDAGSLAEHAMELADIGAALSEGGDLLLYGCDVGRGSGGAAFVDELARLTGADVAASSGATGSAVSGGDWTLEVEYGPIEASALVGVDFPALLAASVSIVPQQAPEREGIATAYTFVAIRSGDLSTLQTVGWSVTGSGAHSADAADFGGTLPSGTVTFGIGEANKLVALSVTDDAAVEFDEGFTVTLANTSGGLLVLNGSASGTIANDDASISVAALDATRAEGHSGTTEFTFAVARAGDLSAPHVVSWRVMGTDANPATAADFDGDVLPSGTVTFAPGETSRTVTVPVAGDSAVESDEQFAMQIEPHTTELGPRFTIAGSGIAGGTIRNDDATVSISAVDAVEREGNVGTTKYTFDVSLHPDDNGPTDDIPFDYGAIAWAVTGSGEHAATAVDFAGGVLPSGAVTFAPGETSKKIVVEVSGDSTVEADEGFVVTLSAPSPGVAIGTAMATARILNDDASISIAALDAIREEGHSGPTIFAYATAPIAWPTEGEWIATIAWSVVGSGHHAATASDFVGGILPSGVVTFGPDGESKTITVEVAGDSQVEADEEFTVILSDPSPGVVVVTAAATGTILNDDLPVVSIAPLSANNPEGSGGATPFTFTATIDSPYLSDSETPDSVLVWSVAGIGPHPADGSDFVGGVLPSGTVTFAPGETSTTITVEVSGDSTVEADEGFTVNLSQQAPGLAIGTAVAIGVIGNDDYPRVEIAAIDAAKAEGNGGTTAFVFAVTTFVDIDSSDLSGGSLTLAWSVTGTGGHAASASDFGGDVLPSGTVTFAPGEISKTIAVEAVGDAMVEADESFAVVLSDPSPGLVIDTAAATGTILNDDSSIVSITSSHGTCVEAGNVDTCSMVITLDQAPVSTQTVRWSTAGSGPAPASASDFVGGILPSGTLTFAPGEISRTIELAVAADTLVEPDEGFTVSLSDLSSGLVPGSGSAAGLILDDDASVAIVATDSIKREGASGSAPFAFLLTRSGDLSVAHDVSWSVAGTGANPAIASDFPGGILPSGTTTFAAGETSKTLMVLVAGDAAVGPDEGFVVTLSNPSAGLTIGVGAAVGVILNDDLHAHDDAYVVLQGHALSLGGDIGVLVNDEAVPPVAVSVLDAPAHGRLLEEEGIWYYTPVAGFAGIDEFSYRSSGGNGAADEALVTVYVVPLLADAGVTLDLLALTAEEQIAATYIAFFGRAADADGFAFWLNELQAGLPTQGPAALFANIASSFGISDEAKALYPFLAQPSGVGDGQIGAFLGSVYDNLFGRPSDAAGLDYWAGQIKQALATGRFVGSVLVDIIGGAQESSAGRDVTTLMSKVAVGLHHVREQERVGMPWTDDDGAAATALLQAVTSEPRSVLVGLASSDTFVASHVASWSMDVLIEGDNAIHGI